MTARKKKKSHETARLIDQGKLRRLERKFGHVKTVMGFLRAAFGGMYITSNAVEVRFWVKSWLRPHRCVKNGSAALVNLKFFGCHVFQKLPEWEKTKVINKLTQIH